MSDSLLPMDYSLPGSSVHEIVQERILEWVAIPFFRGSSWPRDWTRVSRLFTIWATRLTSKNALPIVIWPNPKNVCTSNTSFIHIVSEDLKWSYRHFCWSSQISVSYTGYRLLSVLFHEEWKTWFENYMW